jgi:hypothetical protein
MFQIIQSVDSIQQWLKNRPLLDLNPVYQRRSQLWDTRRKALLIDSILNGYDIPKFYVADLTFMETRAASPVGLPREVPARFAVIDGKQRFEAIFEFFDDGFPLAQNFVLEEDPSMLIGGMRYSELDYRFPALSSRFLAFGLNVVHVITDDEARITSLFVRLNSSTPLTGAEVRNAMEGEVPKLIRGIARHPFFSEYVRFQIKRGQDWNVAAKLLLLEGAGRFTDTKRPQLDWLVTEAKRADSELGDLHRAAERVERVLDAMCDVFVPGESILRSQGPIPVFYWFVREHPDAAPEHLGEFLRDFMRELAEVRSLRRTGEEYLVDPDVALFIDLNRNVNDQRSLEGRYEILERRFSGSLVRPIG